MTGLERIIDRCKASIIITVNDHATGYQTVEEYFSDLREMGSIDACDEDEVQRCIAAGSICAIQAYSDTPIGFFRVYEPTLDEAVWAMLRVLGLPEATT